MSDFINDKQCVTHHYACDCREAAHKKELAEKDAEIERWKKTVGDTFDREQGLKDDKLELFSKIARLELEVEKMMEILRRADIHTLHIGGER